MKKRVAIVTPWFGEAAKGGAESLASELALRLSTDHHVTVLTTCSRSFLAEWDDNYYPPGIKRDSAYNVERFPVAPRSRHTFDAANRALLDLPKDRWIELRYSASLMDTFIDESINAPQLEMHLAKEARARYDAVLFLPYLYGIVVRGIEAYRGPAHLIPCLHDEAYARLPRIERAIHRAGTILANSDGEAELALRLYGPGILHKLHVIGSGVDAGSGPLPDLPATVSKPFVLYVGRRDLTKNVDALIAAYRRFRTNESAPLGLVLAGPGTSSYHDMESGVVDLGFVEEGLKSALIEASLGIVQPSANESYSRVMMEAWMRARPVAVNGSCLATAHAVREAGGGYLADSEDDWVEIFRRFANGDADELRSRGHAGESYARDKSDWNRVLKRLRSAVGFDVVHRDLGRGRRVDQFVQTLEYGDAISDYALQIQSRLKELGFESTIYAEGIGPRMIDRALRFEPDSFLASEAILYHHSIASKATNHIIASRARKAMIYHNITPAEFFRPYNESFANLLETGRAQTSLLMGCFDAFLADSDFNAAELIDMGAAAVRTLPVAIDFHRFDQLSDRAVFAERAGVTNVLFVGRIAPSKGIHKLLDAFEAFLCLDASAHLTIVGRYDVLDPYYLLLSRRLVERSLGSAVTFAGVVAEPSLLAYFQLADLYVSMSEHEGFCVPLVEAMFFDVPVLALGTTAIPETMAQGGLLFSSDADAFDVAAMMHATLTDEVLAANVIAAQRERRRFFRPEVAEQRIDGVIEELLR